ncbi:hypothetical protein [Bradyrhizobium prioriisuperbiae]|uniref:hypothetical protein n=1 Tax=Bradyrhizobium prioriisuperbiae TaxID=2854389 RepID=UPI0028E5A374|nr:hypothetical protein [Bradyrhizobium prioritasuperba]
MGLLDDQDFDMQGYGGLLGGLLYRGTPPSESGLAEQGRAAAAARLASGIRNGNRTYAGGVFEAGSAPFGLAGPGSLNFGATSTPDLSAFEPAREPEEQGPMPDDAMRAQQARDAAAARVGRGARNANREWTTVERPSVTGADVLAGSNGTVRSAVNAVPIVGGFNNRISAAINASVAPVLNPMFDPTDQLSEPTWRRRYDHSLRSQNDLDARFAEEHPYLDAAAKFVGGSLASGGVAGAVPWAAKASAPLVEKVIRDFGTQAALWGVDALARGGDVEKGMERGMARGAGRELRNRIFGNVLTKIRP